MGSLKHYHRLLPMCMEARKPIFLLKPVDGAIGAHYHSVSPVADSKVWATSMVEIPGSFRNAKSNRDVFGATLANRPLETV